MPDLFVDVAGRELSASWTGDAPETSAAIADALPLEGDATRWGDELYFRTPVDVDPENAGETVPVGALAYWPQGNAICLFWGPTPASRDDEPRAASPVTVFATVAETAPLSTLDGGGRVRITEV